MIEDQPKSGAPAFAPLWTNTKAIRIGYLAGRGYTSPGIAEELDDGTIAGTIRVQLQRSGVRRAKGDMVPVHLSNYELGRLGRLAESHGFEPAEWLRQIAAAAIRDDLYRAIVDAS